MFFPFFISKRFFSDKKTSRFISAISMIAMVGIAIGTAVLIIAFSVVNGFQKEIFHKITAFYSHIDLSAFEGQTLPNYEITIPKIKQKFGSEITNISPYLTQVALIRSRKTKDGVLIKGILPEFDNSELKKNIIKGKYDLSFDKNEYKIILGNKLAKKMSVDVDSFVTIFTLKDYKNISYENFPNIFAFRVVGIYETGMSEYDDITAYTNLATAQNIFMFGDNITGYDIRIKDITKADSLAKEIMTWLGYPFYGRSIFQIHKNILTWVELQKKPIPIILGLIIIVAVFNVVSTLLMIVLEKTSAIGVLKSLGASSRKIKRIFLLNGLVIGIIGTLAGDILAVFLLKLQLEYDIIKIPEGIYFLDKVPIDMNIDSILIISGISLFLSLLCSVIPASLASKINTINALRFN